MGSIEYPFPGTWHLKHASLADSDKGEPATGSLLLVALAQQPFNLDCKLLKGGMRVDQRGRNFGADQLRNGEHHLYRGDGVATQRKEVVARRNTDPQDLGPSVCEHFANGRQAWYRDCRTHLRLLDSSDLASSLLHPSIDHNSAAITSICGGRIIVKCVPPTTFSVNSALVKFDQ